MNRRVKNVIMVTSVSLCATFIWGCRQANNHINGHREQYIVEEYKFADPKIQSEFSNWIASLTYSRDVDCNVRKNEDFDFCYQQYTDYIWNSRQRDVVDSFNIRLHTHSYENNYLRSDNFSSMIKGCCCVGSHTIYLYDNETIRKLFVSKHRTKAIQRYVVDEHGFLDWRDEEVWVAYMDEQLYRKNLNQRMFYRNDFLFYNSIDPFDKTQFIKTINVDTFCIRDCGPYLVMSANEELTRETTINNMRVIFENRLSPNIINVMTVDSRISIICYVDTLGNATYQNLSTEDVRKYVDQICDSLPTFVPAQELGVTVNSAAIFRFYRGDFVNEK